MRHLATRLVPCTLLALGLAAGCGGKSPAPEAPEPADPPAPVAAPAELGPGGCPVVDDDEAAARTREALAAVIAGEHRADENRARDPHRRPLDTLLFFGLRDDMTVVELWPGGGWYTEILAPVLAERGTLIATNFDPDGPEDENATRYARRFRDVLAGNPEVFGKVGVSVVAPPEQLELADPGSVDLVVTFRNNQGWIRDGYQDRIYEAAFAALRPCGAMGVVQHRAAPGTDPATAGETGYVTEEVVISAAEAAGFVLAERSELNANPKDTRDHPGGVWALPPALRNGDEERERFVAIGESDRMTLRFVKPTAAQ
jgi:predicted methyltransferase